jgi:hypothetical protein
MGKVVYTCWVFDLIIGMEFDGCVLFFNHGVDLFVTNLWVFSYYLKFCELIYLLCLAIS